jgi:hypothetical protein
MKGEGIDGGMLKFQRREEFVLELYTTSDIFHERRPIRRYGSIFKRKFLYTIENDATVQYDPPLKSGCVDIK